MKNFREQVVAGLSQHRRALCRANFFTTKRGSALFPKICELPEYYITRTEMRDFARVRRRDRRGTRPRNRIDRLRHRGGNEDANPAGESREAGRLSAGRYLARTALTQSAIAFRKRFPALEVLPVCADYLQPFELPRRSGLQTRSRRCLFSRLDHRKSRARRCAPRSRLFTAGRRSCRWL